MLWMNRNADGLEINADINGAANIGRKQGEEYSPEAIENLKRWPRRVKVIEKMTKPPIATNCDQLRLIATNERPDKTPPFYT